jgi:hypothetical protein
MQPPLDLALSYLAQGWPVFPCRAQTTETHDPDTGEVSELKVKTPYTSNGFKAATKVERIVRRWWQDHPDAMVGVPTGAPISSWVLDIDRKELPDGSVINGYDTLTALEGEHGELPPTRRVRTPSGGTHYFFRHAPGVRNRGAVGVGIDVRGDGGYVIAGGSVMASGARYEWVDTDAEILDAPDWLLERVTRRPGLTTDHVTAPRVAANDRYVSAAVQRELDTLAAVPMGGGRNVELNKSSFALGTFVGAGALSESEARGMLQDVARQWGRDWALCRRTIENGLKAGIGNPRHVPEPEADNTSLVDFKRMIENGLRKKQKPAQEPIVEPAGDDVEQTAPKPANDNGPLSATPFKWLDPTKLSRREFAFGEHYIRKYVSVTVAPGGLGKSSNSIVEALSMVSGKDLIGTKPTEKGQEGELVCDGSGFRTVGFQQRVLLATMSIAGGSASSGTIELPPGYIRHELKTRLLPSATAAILGRVSTNGGGVWDSGANTYGLGYDTPGGSTSMVVGAVNNRDSMEIAAQQTAGWCFATIEICDAREGAVFTQVNADWRGTNSAMNSNSTRHLSTNNRRAAQIDNALQLYPSTGTMQGSIAVYGHKY